MKTRPSTILAKVVPDDAPAPVQLTGAELTMVAGGLNPQPLPPRVDPAMRA
jgi:hypothetical protein